DLAVEVERVRRLVRDVLKVLLRPQGLAELVDVDVDGDLGPVRLGGLDARLRLEIVAEDYRGELHGTVRHPAADPDPLLHGLRSLPADPERLVAGGDLDGQVEVVD